MKTKPKVAIIVSHPIQHFCPQYASYSNCNDWDTKVFFASSLGQVAYVDQNFQEKISWNNLYLDSFQHQFLNSGKALPINKYLDAPEIEHHLNRYNPDLVIIYGYFQKYQRRATQWAKNNRKKIVYISDSEHAQKSNIIKETLKQQFLKIYFKKIDYFFTVGNHNEHFYAWAGVPMQKMIRNGFPIDISIFDRAYKNRILKRDILRSSLNIDQEEIVVTEIGKVLNFKKQYDLISALHALEETSKLRFTALIVGSGPDLQRVKSYASTLKYNKAIFTGFVYPEYLPDYLAATDIYVHPASKEPHSLSISEAIYMGCPVIISNRCGSFGPTDDVQIGKNGFVYECGNVPHLQKLILHLGENANLRDYFGKISRNLAQTTQRLSHGEGLRAVLIDCGLL